MILLTSRCNKLHLISGFALKLPLIFLSVWLFQGWARWWLWTLRGTGSAGSRSGISPRAWLIYSECKPGPSPTDLSCKPTSQLGQQKVRGTIKANHNSQITSTNTGHQQGMVHSGLHVNFQLQGDVESRHTIRCVSQLPWKTCFLFFFLKLGSLMCINKTL